MRRCLFPWAGACSRRPDQLCAPTFRTGPRDLPEGRNLRGRRGSGIESDVGSIVIFRTAGIVASFIPVAILLAACAHPAPTLDDRTAALRKGWEKCALFTALNEANT